MSAGVFKDANVIGMSFNSGGQAGITGANGSFTYEVGQPVTFSIGGVTIGTTNGKSVVTPIDVVTNGSSTTLAVQNIVRFLLMLDSDGNSANGINISAAVRTAAAGWALVNFSTSAADLPSALASIIASAQAADGGTHVLPSAATAQAHLEATLRCARSGAYRGTFTGTDSGPFGVMINAQSGFLSGFTFSNSDDALLTLSGTAAVSFDQSATFISGDASSGATFSGQFTGPDQLGGIWQLLPTDSGTFSGARIGGAATALYRFTGTFIGDAFGTFTFDVDASDNVQGVAHTVLALADGTLDELSS
ncbi:MAG TPA: hypothetical protein VI565_07660, partial [Burkholderiales bacterium]|nr:hypothetical protein [Burkholderiales bacterium]